MLPTDFMAPTSGVLARLQDARVSQYWDENHTVARGLKDDAEPPQPAQDCCVMDDILWDLVAIYPPGARWRDRLPAAVFFNGPVAHITDQMRPFLPGASQR